MKTDLQPTKLVRLKDIVSMSEVTEEAAARNRQEKADLQSLDPHLRYRKPLKARPASRGLLPISAATWWAGVRARRFPQPVRLSPGCTCWRLKDILQLIDAAAETEAGRNPNTQH